MSMQEEDLPRVTASDLSRLQSTTPKKLIVGNISLDSTVARFVFLDDSEIFETGDSRVRWVAVPSRGGLSFGVGVARQIYSLVFSCPAIATSPVRSSPSFFLFNLNVCAVKAPVSISGGTWWSGRSETGSIEGGVRW